MAGSVFTPVPRNNAIPLLPALKRVYRCQCGRPIFFSNSHCLNCGSQLGYEPAAGKVVALIPTDTADLWTVAGLSTAGREYLRCTNRETPAGCNWLVRNGPSAFAAGGLCISCRLTRTIPDLSVRQNTVYWGRIEAAKRRVVSQLAVLELPLASRVSEDRRSGLAFDLLGQVAGCPPVLTGHAHGIITVNIHEADDAAREKIRADMHEPYRTLVGHIRHEIGHYYWYRLVDGTRPVDGPGWLQAFRQLFGDERANYTAALQQHYLQGPSNDWASRYVSAYASVHPWEDWAETWAHYLHMIDTVGTATSFGLRDTGAGLQFDRFTPETLYHPEHPSAEQFLTLLNSWVELSAVLNELARSMGHQDLYPFALPRSAVGKLQFIHMLVGAADRLPPPLPPPLAPRWE